VHVPRVPPYGYASDSDDDRPGLARPTYYYTVLCILSTLLLFSSLIHINPCMTTFCALLYFIFAQNDVNICDFLRSQISEKNWHFCCFHWMSKG